MKQEIRNQLFLFATMAEKQGYEAAKKAIMVCKTPGLDKDFALHIAYLSEKYGQVIGQDAIYFPEKYDKRSESEKIADMIAGNNAHLNPEFGKEEKLYKMGGLVEIPGTNGGAFGMPKPNKEECLSIAAMIDRGTQDILEHPGINPAEAMANANLLRELKGK